MEKIRVEHVGYDSACQYAATFDDYEPGGLVGFGRTVKESREDLLDQVEEE